MGRMKDFYHDEIEKNMRDFDDTDFAYQQYLKQENCNGNEVSSCCGKPFVGETDICSDCKEHSASKCIDCLTPCNKIKN